MKICMGFGNTLWKITSSSEEKYPGYVRSFGIAIAYQHFLWKGTYAAVHAMNVLQKYAGEDNQKIQDRYQLFMTYRLGYHFPLFQNRFFIEPSVAMTYRPVNTNVPESFAKLFLVLTRTSLWIEILRWLVSYIEHEVRVG